MLKRRRGPYCPVRVEREYEIKGAETALERVTLTLEKKNTSENLRFSKLKAV